MVGIEKVLMGLGNFVLDVEAKQTQIFVSGDEIKKIYVTWHENPSPNKKSSTLKIWHYYSRA